MNRLSLSNCLKYVFSKHPILSTVFFFNKDPTKYICTQKVISSEADEDSKKVIGLSILYMTGYSVYPLIQRKQYENFPCNFLVYIFHQYPFLSS